MSSGDETDEDGDSLDVKALYPMLSTLSPDDWEDGSLYGLLRPRDNSCTNSDRGGADHPVNPVNPV